MHRSTRTTGLMRTAPLAHRHVMFVEGDAGGGSPAPAGGQPAGTPAPAPAPAGGEPAAPAPAPPAPKDQPPAAPSPAPGDALPTDPAELQRMILDLRRENGSARTNAKAQAADEARQQLAQDIGKALGLVKDDQPADPAEVARQVADSQATARQAQVELAVFRAAGTHQGDPNALLDSRAFLAKIADLDPTASDFAAKVDGAIKDAVSANPKLKTVQAAGASGADLTGGTGETPTRTPRTLDQAVSAHYGT